MTFQLDPRLEGDCHLMGESDTSLLLLMDNALVTWFIVVPRTDKTELHELERETQLTLLDETHALAECLKNDLEAEKINTAAIGNVVRQLHIHVIGRKESDFCWPHVVWGAKERKAYTGSEIEQIKEILRQRVSPLFRIS